MRKSDSEANSSAGPPRNDAPRPPPPLVRELRITYGRRRALPAGLAVTSPAGAAEALRATGIREEVQECFAVVCLDAQHRPTSWSIVARGSLSACPVEVRDVFLHAIAGRAAAILVGHNHPSGDPTPSDADHNVTDALVQAGLLLRIPVTESLVVAAGGWVALGGAHSGRREGPGLVREAIAEGTWAGREASHEEARP